MRGSHFYFEPRITEQFANERKTLSSDHSARQSTGVAQTAKKAENHSKEAPSIQMLVSLGFAIEKAKTRLHHLFQSRFKSCKSDIFVSESNCAPNPF